MEGRGGWREREEGVLGVWRRMGGGSAECLGVRGEYAESEEGVKRARMRVKRARRNTWSSHGYTTIPHVLVVPKPFATLP